MITKLSDIPNIKTIANEFVFIGSQIKEVERSNSDFQAVEELEAKLRGITFTLLIILGMSTFSGTRQWLKEELERIAKS